MWLQLVVFNTCQLSSLLLLRITAKVTMFARKPLLFNFIALWCAAKEHHLIYLFRFATTKSWREHQEVGLLKVKCTMNTELLFSVPEVGVWSHLIRIFSRLKLLQAMERTCVIFWGGSQPVCRCYFVSPLSGGVVASSSSQLRSHVQSSHDG